MSQKYKWPLSDSNFTLLDRLKICQFFLDPKKQWTSGPEVKKYENKWAQDVQSNCIMVSSGSAANTLIAQYTRDKNPNKKYIVLPTIGWMTTFQPFLREGFEPIFIDVNFHDLSMDLDKLEKFLKKNAGDIALVFIVSLLGFSPDIDRLLKIQEKYNIEIKLDCCESSNTLWKGKSIMSYFTSSTSLFFSHIMTCGGESGLIFTKDREEFKYYLLASNHGMVRGLQPYIKNVSKSYEDISELNWNELIWEDYINLLNKELKDNRFDFAKLGNNHRSTDTAAFIGGLDLNRKNYYNQRRLNLYSKYFWNIDSNKYQSIKIHQGDIPFAIPIIIKGKNKKKKERRFDQAVGVCERLRIETRLLVSGSIFRQTAFKHLGNPLDYKNTEELHNYSFYAGLNPKIKEGQVLQLVKELNKL